MSNPVTTPLLAAKSRAASFHSRIPGLRKLPLAVIMIILLLISVNLLVWAGVGAALSFHPNLTGPAVLAYTLGLRHALDADHIAAIDLTTRRLIAAGQTPVSVGTFFSLGHSTIVIVTSIAVAATSAGLSSRFDDFERIGGIIGTSVSAAFLVVLAVLNAWVLYKLIVEMRMHLKGMGRGQEEVLEVQLGRGPLTRVLKGCFRMIDRPWKMYPLGVLFGLGFDTSSEIALLGLASVHGAQGTSIWLILLFPLLFTAGMCLLDTTDGALMSALYQTSAFAQDRTAVLYYSIVLTVITVIVAIVIGVIQILSLVLNVGEYEGGFWDGVEKVGEYYDVLGAGIVGLFVVAGVGSLLFYGTFKRWAAKRYGMQVGVGEALVGEAEENESALPDVSGLVPGAPKDDLENGKRPVVTAGEVGPSGEGSR